MDNALRDALTKMAKAITVLIFVYLEYHFPVVEERIKLALERYENW